MVMQTNKVETDSDELSVSQMDDIRALVKSGFRVEQIATWHKLDPVALQKRLDNAPRQRSLFPIGGES